MKIVTAVGEPSEIRVMLEEKAVFLGNSIQRKASWLSKGIKLGDEACHSLVSIGLHVGK